MAPWSPSKFLASTIAISVIIVIIIHNTFEIRIKKIPGSATNKQKSSEQDSSLLLEDRSKINVPHLDVSTSGAPSPSTAATTAGPQTTTIPSHLKYPYLEPILPSHIIYYITFPIPPITAESRYSRYKEPLGERDRRVCTKDDIALRNSEPFPSTGCQKQDNAHPRIIFLCLTPIHVSCSITRSNARDLFYRNLLRTTVKCVNMTLIGSVRMDGAWPTCGEAPFNLVKNDCLVYSVGIQNEWSFDDTCSKQYGCEVHSFDPTMGVEDYKRDERITFHKMGVLGHGDRFGEAKQKGWKMKTIKDIIQFLGHKNRIIDILKLDIEFTEWDAFEDALNSNALKKVKQIATEFHVWSDEVKTYVRFHRILVALENAGFEKFHVGRKMHFEEMSQETGELTKYYFQADYGFINTRFLF